MSKLSLDDMIDYLTPGKGIIHYELSRRMIHEKIIEELQRIPKIEEIIRDTIWMARRYADGRSSYATTTFNRARMQAEALGVSGLRPDNDGKIYASDGMFGEWDPDRKAFVKARMEETK